MVSPAFLCLVLVPSFAGCVLLPDLLFQFYMSRCGRYFDTGKLLSIRVAVETKIHVFLCVLHLTAVFIISETSFF